jgi:hypothetical protein
VLQNDKFYEDRPISILLGVQIFSPFADAGITYEHAAETALGEKLCQYKIEGEK